MSTVECIRCGGNCDPGELREGMCHECRQEDIEESLEAEKYFRQQDGQMCMKLQSDKKISRSTELRLRYT